MSDICVNFRSVMDFRQLLVLAVLNELVPPSSVGSLPVETQCGDYTAGGRSL